jgi:hypothetical protein
MVKKTTDSIISKMLSNLSCLVFDRSSVMKKNQVIWVSRIEEQRKIYQEQTIGLSFKKTMVYLEIASLSIETYLSY